MLEAEAEVRARNAEAEVQARRAEAELREQKTNQQIMSGSGVGGDWNGGGAEAGHGGDPTHTTAVIRGIQEAKNAGDVSPYNAERLQALFLLLDSWRQEGLIAFDAPTGSEMACIMGWVTMWVNDPKVVNDRLRDMVQTNHGGVWRKNIKSGEPLMPLINPTWTIYELFRKIGAKPRFRGPVDTDPGKHDMFYYEKWVFINDETFKTARKRLATYTAGGASSRPRLQGTGEGGSAQPTGTVQAVAHTASGAAGGDSRC